MIDARRRLTRVRAQLYNGLRRWVPQPARRRLKRRLGHVRRQLAPLYRARYGTFDAAALMAELGRHVPADAEIVMVHCSFNDLAPTYTGTARELLDGLVELTGPSRTLAMPAFFFAGARNDPVAHYRETPRWDARRQASETGVLSEAFRRRRGVRRSLHPTHSVCALGPLAGELVEGHHLAGTTFGEGTPFAVMAAHRTAILGIGTEYFRNLTQVHAAEDLLGDRYPLRLRPTTVPVELRDVDGTLHPYALPVGDPVTQRRQSSRLGHLLGPGELAQWTFHGVPLFATTAARVTDALTAAALRGETIYDLMPIRPRG